MSIHSSNVISTAVKEVGLPSRAASVLEAECPWLNGTEEISESLGRDLLEEQAAALQLTDEQVQSFLRSYNALIRAVANPFESLQSEAYAEVAAALVGQGRADSFGEGDYWVNAESFSTRNPEVIVFGGFRFSENVVQVLQRIVASYASVFSELRISSEGGAEVITLRAK